MSDGWFGAVPEELPKRDRWGRPLLVPRGGGDRVAYTRASTLGNFVEDHSGLHTWEKRYLTKGMGDREDLAAMAAALPALTGDWRTDGPTNRKLDEIAALASEHAGQYDKANYGTAIHGFTDPGAQDLSVPTRMRADVQSYFNALAEAEQTESELFVANDDYGAAGTLDGVYIIPGMDQEILADKKTGSLHPLGFAVQLAVYASGDVYDVDTDRRGDRLEERVSQEVALLIHIPRLAGETHLYWIDLERARFYAKLACQVRSARADKDILRPISGSAFAQAAMIHG